ncbi:MULTISPECIES: hypothetical protein [unclassified Beijerinckia]|uniref:hypothetical protein n=1 Tax=unclassified Beijerinckia TaxID=2638183 RepID=UPI0008982DD8|nr:MULTISPECIES: hypothetical protein [unclassified Beijerinckia]MDH7797833.1 DNA-binding MarR family transcriptional regulator [Beijerinckia sp. GAS462]SED00110.1 DNA-binding transcriptional regulator, MarR family [Beijerinckia sp. 28-YEA-48]
MTGTVRRPRRVAASRPRLPAPGTSPLDTGTKASRIRQKNAALEADSILPATLATPPFLSEPSVSSQGPLLRHLRRIAFDTYEALAGNLGISPVGSLLLRILATGPCDSDKLRELAALDTVSFAKEIGFLQQANLTAITAPSADRRRRIYALTKEGRATLIRVRRVIASVERSFLAGLNEREASLFTRIFTKLVLAHSANGTIRQNPAVMDLLDGKLDPVALLRRGRQISVDLFTLECGTLNITPIESGALNLIGAFETIATKDLPKLIDVNRGSAFAVVAKLLAMGFLSPEEHAQRRLTLTPIGKIFQKDLALRVKRVNARMLSVLNRSEQTHLIRLMQSIYQHSKTA